MDVLIVRPMEVPERAQIDDNLEAEQQVVGGFIEMFCPYDDEVALICNEEGKIDGLPLNRAVRDDNGNILDVIAGTFFVCAVPSDSENFESLSPEQMVRYEKMFQHPEEFIILNGKIEAFPLPVPKKEKKNLAR